jgi:hypothetical protein
MEDEAPLAKSEYSDRCIVDTSPAGRRPSLPGTFLCWDGFADTLGEIAVHPDGTGKKFIAKVTTPHGSFERRRTSWRSSGAWGIFKKAG